MSEQKTTMPQKKGDESAVEAIIMDNVQSLATGAAEIGKGISDSAIKAGQEIYQAVVGEVPVNQPTTRKCTDCTCENCQCAEGTCQCGRTGTNGPNNA